MTLTKHNLERFLDAIAYRDLAQTFRVAVSVSVALGIRYLWIDSLCILQDSLDDWINESKTMQDVYTHAYCTIAATCTTSSTDGMLRDRDPSTFIFMTTEMAWIDSQGISKKGDFALIEDITIIDEYATSLVYELLDIKGKNCRRYRRSFGENSDLQAFRSSQPAL